MNKNSLLTEIGRRLRSARAALNYSRTEMGAQFGISMTGYTKNENGATAPRIGALYKLGTRFNISLDWLICGKGAMISKGQGTLAEKLGVTESLILDDVKDLLRHMERIPRLRYEILGQFHKFKEENIDLVSSAMENPDK
ncbi:MAG: helix-turn-helix transcriptional regulator [Candidatus Aminicenantes bacterium]|nr:helix-turn-helix transcriptional regulator [Candidatus Aminicenantes bacterium]